MMRVRLSLLREFVHAVCEAAGVGERLDAEEAAAKIEYEKAKHTLATFDSEMAKKQAYLDRAKQLGIKPDSDSKQVKALKAMPEYSYDYKMVNGGDVRRNALVARVEKARNDYASYAPLEAGPATSDDSASDEPSKGKKPDPKKPAVARISDIKPVREYAWNDPRWAKLVKKHGAIFGKKSGDDDKTGTGPGEAHLAAIFGAEVQGGGTSFDLVTKDGRKWEVKGLESGSSTIRPGTEGRRAYAATKRHLENIMRQMKAFVSATKKVKLEGKLSDQEQNALSIVVDFIDHDYEEIVGKGEITGPRRKALRSALKSIKFLRETWKAQGADVGFDTVIGLGGKEFKVDKPTYIDVAKKVKKATDIDVLEGMQGKELALGVLKDPGFEDPSKFLDQWYESVDINQVFAQVDGVFIVTPDGFYLVPKPLFKKAFRFEKVSQGQPRFVFTYDKRSNAESEATKEAA